MSPRRYGLLAACLFSLAACASTGNQETSSLQTALVELVSVQAMPFPALDPVQTMIESSKSVRHSDLPRPPVQLGSIHARIISGPEIVGPAEVLPVSAGQPKSKLAGRTIYMQDTRDIILRPKEVVLTFDDGPVPTKTPAVLAALQEHGVKATFFMVGEMAYHHSEIAREVVAGGHTIATHTYGHPHLSAMAYDRATAEIAKGTAAVSLATGVVPHFFRFPYLAETVDLDRYLADNQMIPVGVDVDSRDYQPSTPTQVVNRVMSDLDHRGGGIILMHDLQGRTASAIGPLLDRLEAGGYKVVDLRFGAPLLVEQKPQHEKKTLFAMLGWD